MSAIWLVLIAIAAFIVAYLTYGSYIVRKLGINPKIKTPAHTMRDDFDYVPARAPVLMGHHFASISGAAPILGPIVAAAFGWIPVFLWIVLGGIFMGAVHDTTALFASIRHRAKSISEVLKENVGVSSKKLFAAFATLTLILYGRLCYRHCQYVRKHPLGGNHFHTVYIARHSLWLRYFPAGGSPRLEQCNWRGSAGSLCVVGDAVSY